MVASSEPPVKGVMRFIDCHPRLGWYVALIVTLDFVGVDTLIGKLLG